MSERESSFTLMVLTALQGFFYNPCCELDAALTGFTRRYGASSSENTCIRLRL